MEIIIFIVQSPLDQFEVTSLISFSAPVVGDFVIALTNLGLYSIITILLVTSIHIFANNSLKLIPSRWSVALETIYASVHGIVRDQIGSQHEAYFPFIYALFWWLLIANLNGNIVYGYTVTTSGITALGLSVIVFIGVTLIGLSKHKLHFFSFFVPGGTPTGLVPILTLIETVSYLARAGSLGVRLFSNITAGHTLLKILSTFLAKLFTAGVVTAIITLIPFMIFIGLIGLEIAVSFIQSYVFCVLTCSYIKDAIELHLLTI